MRNETNGNIASIRAVEDCIRATRKYTEGIGTMRKHHPIQGNGFTSKVFCKYYEVYPQTEIYWDMPAGVALDWLWGETPKVDVTFKYDYRSNKASILVQNGITALKELEKGIPGFSKALAMANGNRDDSQS